MNRRSRVITGACSLTLCFSLWLGALLATAAPPAVVGGRPASVQTVSVQAASVQAVSARAPGARAASAHRASSSATSSSATASGATGSSTAAASLPTAGRVVSPQPSPHESTAPNPRAATSEKILTPWILGAGLAILAGAIVLIVRSGSTYREKDKS
jgi:hypothetical protein